MLYDTHARPHTAARTAVRTSTHAHARAPTHAHACTPTHARPCPLARTRAPARPRPHTMVDLCLRQRGSVRCCQMAAGPDGMAVHDHMLQQVRCFQLTGIADDIVVLEDAFELNLMGVPSLLARKLLMPRLLHMAHGIQTYFQQLRPLHNCTQEDGKAVGNLLMEPVIIRILTRIIRILTRIIRTRTRRTTCCPPRSITGPMWRRPSACAQQCSAMRPSRTSIPSWWLSRAASTAEAVASRRSIIRARTHIIRALIRIIRTPTHIIRTRTRISRTRTH